MSLPTIYEMDRKAEKRQADHPIPKEARSENQGCPSADRDPLDQAKEGRLSSLRKRNSQLSFNGILHVVFHGEAGCSNRNVTGQRSDPI